MEICCYCRWLGTSPGEAGREGAPPKNETEGEKGRDDRGDRRQLRSIVSGNHDSLSNVMLGLMFLSDTATTAMGFSSSWDM